MKAVKKGDINLKALREKLREPVKGQFRYHESPGSTFKFSYGSKFKGIPIETYIIADNEVRYLPLEVAQHLNSCSYLIFDTFKDANGKPISRIKKKERRVSFDSLSFNPIEDVGDDNNLIVEAEPLVQMK